MGGGDGGKGGQRRDAGRRYAFKVLCPEPLVSSFMGARGATKDSIQEACNCKLIVSNRDEHWPGTRLRILVIYSDDPSGVVAGLQEIINRIIELGDEEQGNWKGEPEFTGKETGEYMFRGIISMKMAGGLIGNGGSNVKAIREENNAKVFIDKSPVQGHQSVKVVAPADGLRSAIARISDCIQQEAHSDWFPEWAAIRSFSGEASGYDSSWHGRDRERSPRRGQEQWNQGWDSGKRAAQTDPTEDVLQAIAATASEFPAESLAMDFTITCDLPTHKVSALIGRHGEHIKQVRRQTGAKIHFEPPAEGTDEGQQSLRIQGPLLSCYTTHALMMKQYHEHDMENQRREEKNAKVSELQEQLNQLQDQLRAVQGEPAPVKGKGKYR